MVKTLSKMITEKLLRWTYIGLQIWGIGQLAAEGPFIILMLLWSSVRLPIGPIKSSKKQLESDTSFREIIFWCEN